MVETLAPRAETAPFLEAAAALLGAKGFTTDPDAISPWLTDWRQRFTGRALGMASPATTDEVAGLVRLCAAHNVPIVPQGGNSGMSGGATPDETGHAVVLSLRRMNAIRSVDTATRSATCEAGVILQVLHEAAEAKGLRFPLSLGGKGSATVGGLISTNAGGTQVLRHGSMRALVLGLEAVMPDGTVFNQLVPLKKDNRGFDLKQLLIGSEGTLGVVTAATLKLEPAVAAREVLWAGTQSLPQARELLLLAEGGGGGGRGGGGGGGGEGGARQPLAEDHAWHVLIEMVADADGAERLPDLAQRVLEEAFEAGLIDDATMAANETQAEAFWNLRESIAPAERALGPAVQHDISVPVEKMPAFVEEAVPQFEAQWPGTRAVGFGHLGDGNIHFHVIAPQGVDRASWEAGDGKAISRQVHDMVTAWGGSISAEHGIGQLKRDELARLGDPVALSILRHIKQALDPQGLMNPGKLI